MLKYLGLVVLSLAACTTQGKDPEAIGKVVQALPGPAPIHVSAQFTLGESSYTRVVTFPKLFSLDETEVTVDQYSDCVDASACTAPGTDTGCNWGVMGRDDHPVNCVTFYQATQYCAWAGKRLPTAEEWEFAYRYPDGRAYAWGSSSTGYESNANTNSAMDGYDGTTAPVGSYPGGDTALGLKDMLGNVFELTQHSYCEDTAACTNCPDGETCDDACSTCANSSRATKGGSYAHAPSYGRGAFTSYQGVNDGHPTIGFRCALTDD